LGHLAARLRTLGPQGTLDRGYDLVLDEKNQPVMKAEKTVEGQAVRVVLSRGMVKATLGEKEPGKALLDALEKKKNR
jgi:exodeoxyribonuclease VII large subunit